MFEDQEKKMKKNLAQVMIGRRCLQNRWNAIQEDI
jgi:hypothetical protein